jgi:hypothetical protein
MAAEEKPSLALVLGGEVSAPKGKKPAPEAEYEEDEGDAADDVLKVSALEMTGAEAVMDAFQSGSVEQLAKALKGFNKACK